MKVVSYFYIQVKNHFHEALVHIKPKKLIRNSEISQFLLALSQTVLDDIKNML